MQQKNQQDDLAREGEALMARVALTDAEVDAEIEARTTAETQK